MIGEIGETFNGDIFFTSSETPKKVGRNLYGLEIMKGVMNIYIPCPELKEQKQ